MKNISRVFVITTCTLVISGCSAFQGTKKMTYCDDSFVKQTVIENIQKNVESIVASEAVDVKMDIPKTVEVHDGEQTCQADVIIKIKRGNYKAKTSAALVGKSV